MMTDLISVLLPVYNAESFLHRSILSILSQSYILRLSLLMMAQQTHLWKVAQSFTDDRLRIFSTPNRGLTSALNLGLTLANGNFIARQDADDFSPDRFLQQLSFLNSNPDVFSCWYTITYC